MLCHLFGKQRHRVKEAKQASIQKNTEAQVFPRVYALGGAVRKFESCLSTARDHKEASLHNSGCVRLRPVRRE